MSEDRIPLAEAIQALREELLIAMRSSVDSQLRFNLGSVEMVFGIEATRTVGAEGGVKFWVVNAGGSGSTTRAATQQLTLTLQPVSSAGGRVEVTSMVTDDIG